MSNEISIKNEPSGDIIWKGLGGHFDSISQVINEFLDNSISNFIAYNPIVKNIFITVRQLPDRKVFFSIEDSGLGIKNLDSAFTLGAQDTKDTPFNEHGFGFKHALATANPDNDSWKVCTRTQNDFKDNIYTEIKSPYSFSDLKGIELNLSEQEWPGMSNGSGTYISFTCSEALFKTVTEGFQGNHGFENRIKYLVEDIGFVYSNLIKENIANISVVYENISGIKNNINVKAIEPDFEKTIPPGSGDTKVNLDGNSVSLEYEFGVTKESSHKKYYKRNMSTSGVEIRINGRVIATNLFKEIWGIEKHNSYNYLLVRLNIISQKYEELPITRTSKNGIRKGDPKLEDLFNWVRGFMPEPKKNSKDIDHEIDLFIQLRDLKIKQLSDPKTITTEQNVFLHIGERVSIDLYQKTTDGIKIYEGKKDSSSVQDLYQLKMYWDGCVIDQHAPDEGILIASYHPSSVKSLVSYINKMKDSDDNNYNFQLKVWNDEGIAYPAI